jgi:phosphonopyruvate decarboxylase
MLKSADFGQTLTHYGFQLFCGVPCSFLGDLIHYAMNTGRYISATNEGDAIATCAGAYLGGQKSVMLMQNSGLGNAVSPLTSLIHPFNIPVLILMSWRGAPNISDEPQHDLMGRITLDMLRLMTIDYAVLSMDPSVATAQLATANAVIESGKPYCLVVPKGTFAPEPLQQHQTAITYSDTHHDHTPPPCIGTRTDALNRILKHTHAAILSTTGKTGRECFALGDSPNQLYQIGSMGCVSALGLGLAYAKPRLPVIVVDGDGAALMRLGSWATTGFYGPKNMCHILLDNGVHDSTGGQKTASEAVDFLGCAASMNYPRVYAATSLDQLSDYLTLWQKKPLLTGIYVRISPGSPRELGRPTLSPADVAQRFMTFVRNCHD